MSWNPFARAVAPASTLTPSFNSSNAGSIKSSIFGRALSFANPMNLVNLLIGDVAGESIENSSLTSPTVLSATHIQRPVVVVGVKDGSLSSQPPSCDLVSTSDLLLRAQSAAAIIQPSISRREEEVNGVNVKKTNTNRVLDTVKNGNDIPPDATGLEIIRDVWECDPEKGKTILVEWVNENQHELFKFLFLKDIFTKEEREVLQKSVEIRSDYTLEFPKGLHLIEAQEAAETIVKFMSKIVAREQESTSQQKAASQLEAIGTLFGKSLDLSFATWDKTVEDFVIAHPDLIKIPFNERTRGLYMRVLDNDPEKGCQLVARALCSGKKNSTWRGVDIFTPDVISGVAKYLTNKSVLHFDEENLQTSQDILRAILSDNTVENRTLCAEIIRNTMQLEKRIPVKLVPEFFTSELTSMITELTLTRLDWEEIALDPNKESLVDFLEKFSNLRKLRLQGTEVDVFDMDKLSNKVCQKVEVLELEFCKNANFNSLSKLKTLVLKNVNGVHFQSLPKVSYLSITKSESVTFPSLPELTKCITCSETRSISMGAYPKLRKFEFIK